MMTAEPENSKRVFSAPPFCDSVIQNCVFFTESESKQLVKICKVGIGNTGFVDYICRLLCGVDKDIILVSRMLTGMLYDIFSVDSSSSEDESDIISSSVKVSV